MPTPQEIGTQEPSRTGKYVPRGRIAKKWVAEGYALGLAEARAERHVAIAVEVTLRAVFTVLDVRGFEVSDAQRTQLTECRDPGQLDTWLGRAAAVDHVDEIFT
ncbi:hypothetical protein ACFVVM_34055 [Nocardia sp. NPDC058176]|uniref:hypothetical protein n=1 Tax=Nocardia sp. NPDC058176 TaxID=3346368 RepID=UPI0036DF31EE